MIIWKQEYSEISSGSMSYNTMRIVNIKLSVKYEYKGIMQKRQSQLKCLSQLYTLYLTKKMTSKCLKSIKLSAFCEHLKVAKIYYYRKYIRPSATTQYITYWNHGCINMMITLRMIIENTHKKINIGWICNKISPIQSSVRISLKP